MNTPFTLAARLQRISAELERESLQARRDRVRRRARLLAIEARLATAEAEDAHADADLIRIGRELDEAIAEYERLFAIYNKAEREFFARRPKPPAELRKKTRSGDEFVWSVKQLRASDPWWLAAPGNARLLEIAEAHEAAMQALRDELGVDAAEQAQVEAVGRADEIAREIADIPARTMAGLLVKIRAVKWGNTEWWNREGKPDTYHWADELAAEILDAVEQLAKLQSATSAGEA